MHSHDDDDDGKKMKCVLLRENKKSRDEKMKIRSFQLMDRR